MVLCHGTPKSEMKDWLEQVVPSYPVSGQAVPTPRHQIKAAAAGFDFPVILCGHSHRQRVVRLADGCIVLNPGSVGCPGYSWEVPAPQGMRTGTPDAASAMVGRVRCRQITQVLHVRCDADAMMALANRHDGEGWAQVVATGWVG